MKVEIDEGTLPDISLFDFEKKKFVKDVTNKIVTIIKEKLPKQELFSKCIVKFDYLRHKSTTIFGIFQKWLYFFVLWLIMSRERLVAFLWYNMKL